MFIESFVNIEKDEMKRGLRVFFHAMLWIILSLLIGLAQVVWVAGASLFSPDRFSWVTLYREGGLIFFSIAIVTSIGLDFVLLRALKNGKYSAGELASYVLFPFLFVLVATMFYDGAVYHLPAAKNTEAMYSNIQWDLLLSSLFYALMTKAVQFYQELKQPSSLNPEGGTTT